MDTVLRGLKDVYGEVIIKRCRKMCHRPGRQHVRIARFSPTEHLYVESTRLS